MLLLECGWKKKEGRNWKGICSSVEVKVIEVDQTQTLMLCLWSYTAQDGEDHYVKNSTSSAVECGKIDRSIRSKHWCVLGSPNCKSIDSPRRITMIYCCENLRWRRSLLVNFGHILVQIFLCGCLCEMKCFVVLLQVCDRLSSVLHFKRFYVAFHFFFPSSSPSQLLLLVAADLPCPFYRTLSYQKPPLTGKWSTPILSIFHRIQSLPCSFPSLLFHFLSFFPSAQEPMSWFCRTCSAAPPTCQMFPKVQPLTWSLKRLSSTFRKETICTAKFFFFFSSLYLLKSSFPLTLPSLLSRSFFLHSTSYPKEMPLVCWISVRPTSSSVCI